MGATLATAPSSSSSSSSSAKTSWSLSTTKRIHSLDRCVESLDVHPSQSSRYLLTGSRDGILSVYDLSKSGAEKPLSLQQRSSHERRQRHQYDSDEPRSTAVHKPVARSNATPRFDEYAPSGTASIGVRLGAVICSRWYSIDTGAFISAHTAGSIVIWDTNEMTPVIRVDPFAFEGGGDSYGRCHRNRPRSMDDTTSRTSSNMALSCMDLSSTMPNLVSTGSLRSPLVKLVDIRTGAASHTLIGHGKSSGICSLQWSPTAPHVLASGCSMGVVRLWDIRKAGRNAWLLECFEPEQPAPSLHVSNAYYPDLSHLANAKKNQQDVTPRFSPSKTKQKFSSKTKRLGSAGTARAPNDYSQSDQSKFVRSHEGAVDALAFDPSGQFLVSHGKGDLSLKAWDLRDAGQLIPRRYPVSRGAGFNTTKLRIAKQNRFDRSNDSTMIWISQDTRLSAFSLHEGGQAQYRLQGHLKSIRDFFVLPPDASLHGELFTSAADGLILAWHPTIVKDAEAPGNDDQRKRRRPALVDEDTW